MIEEHQEYPYYEGNTLVEQHKETREKRTLTIDGVRYMMLQDDTGVEYSEAIDPIDSTHTYSETSTVFVEYTPEDLVSEPIFG